MTDIDDIARASMPLCALLGISTELATTERVVLTLDWRADLCTVGGAMHGGVLMSLADSCGAVCAFLNLPEGAAGTSTIQSSTSLLRAVRDGTVTATSTPTHVGRTTIVVTTQVHNEGRLVATTIQTQVVLAASGR
jgi:1,4-dihydroxy-2-naphthoyl-CoA hydrolase